MTHILILPPEIIIHIIKFMDDRTFIRFTNTNKQLQKYRKEKILNNWYNYYRIINYVDNYNFSSIIHIPKIDDLKVFPKLNRIKIFRTRIAQFRNIPKEIKIEYEDDTYNPDLILFLGSYANHSNPMPYQYSDYMQPWQVGMSFY